MMRNVNTSALEYAPAVSKDLLELFYTAFDPARGSAEPVIMRAARDNAGAPFGVPARVTGITGFVEAPTLSGDGRSLYYHKLENGRHAIYRVTR